MEFVEGKRVLEHAIRNAVLDGDGYILHVRAPKGGVRGGARRGSPASSTAVRCLLRRATRKASASAPGPPPSPSTPPPPPPPYPPNPTPTPQIQERIILKEAGGEGWWRKQYYMPGMSDTGGSNARSKPRSKSRSNPGQTRPVAGNPGGKGLAERPGACGPRARPTPPAPRSAPRQTHQASPRGAAGLTGERRRGRARAARAPLEACPASAPT
jgi:hypothetical protein